MTEVDADPTGAKQLMETDICSDDSGADGPQRVRLEEPLISLWN